MYLELAVAGRPLQAKGAGKTPGLVLPWKEVQLAQNRVDPPIESLQPQLKSLQPQLKSVLALGQNLQQQRRGVMTGEGGGETEEG